VRRAHGLTVDAFGRDLLPTPPLAGRVKAHDQRALGPKGVYEQAQQHATRVERRPAGPVAHAMVVLEMALIVLAHHA
jgi:hypothetical protein